MMKILVLIIYLVSLLFYLLHLFFNKRSLLITGFLFLCAGFLLHTSRFIMGINSPESFPAYYMGGVMSFFSILLGCVFIAYQIKELVPALGYITVPAILFFYIISISLPHTGSFRPEFKTILFPIHVTFSMAGYVFFFLSFATGACYLLQERNLKFKLFGWSFKRIPSLVELDSMNYRTVQLGFTFITLGMLTGSIWSQRLRGSIWNWDPKEVLTLMVWLLYATYLHLRLILGWKGRKTAILSVIGFMLVIVAFFGRKLVPGGYHDYI